MGEAAKKRAVKWRMTQAKNELDRMFYEDLAALKAKQVENKKKEGKDENLDSV